MQNIRPLRISGNTAPGKAASSEELADPESGSGSASGLSRGLLISELRGAVTDRPIKRSYGSSTRLYRVMDRLCLRISGECFGSAKKLGKPFMRATLACALPVADQ